ncbi:MAG: pilus assembly protein PilP [Deltaproteobacteria bacterium]|nr:pilus assembly protein PilP [Deltaproteobacteria bacterium]
MKKEPPKPEVASPVVETKKEEKKEETAVEVKQRNPFKPFITKATERVTVIVPKTPLQKYDVEQLKLVAIIWGVDNPMAMVEAPDGKGYRIKKGNLIGNKDGRVKRIEKDKIVIEEKFAEPGGEIKTNEFEIKLPLSKGEEELQ